MSQKDAFLRDFQMECKKTRKMLGRVPFEHAAWKPHEKSTSLRALAQHIASLPIWVSYTLEHDELDFAKPMERLAPVESSEELMALFEKRLLESEKLIDAASDELLDSSWTMRMGEQIYFTSPKKEVLRDFVISHIIHHRGQLSLYLRLLDVPVPGMYGPTADER